MKPLKTAVLVSVITLAAVPAMAQSVNVGGLFPSLIYPETTPEPVTKGNAGINK